MARGGGDWGDDDRNAPPPRADEQRDKAEAPKASVWTLFGLVGMVLILGGGVVLMQSIRGSDSSSYLPRNTPGAKERWKQDILDEVAPDLKSPLKTAQEEKQRKAREMNETARLRRESSDEAKQLMPRLENVWEDFDIEARDEVARQLVELHENMYHPFIVDEALFRAAAYDALLSLKKPQKDWWGTVAMRTEAWELIEKLDPNAYATPKGAEAFCLAGQQAKAEGVFRWLYENSDEPGFKSSAMACGLTQEGIGGSPMSYRPRSDELGVIAAREELKPLRMKAFKDVARHSDDSVEHLGLAAVLYLDDGITAREFYWKVLRASNLCEGLTPNLESENELPRPEVFLQAAKKLATTKIKPIDPSIDRLEAVALHSALIHQVDPPAIKLRGPMGQRCMARLEYERDPAAAQKRLRGIVKREPDDQSALEMLALASARAGDFETALDAVERLLPLTRPRHSSRHNALWMQLAFAHKLGRLETVKFDEEHELLVQTRGALLGDENDRRRLRSNPPKGLIPTVLLASYVRGALAPGYEELYADGYHPRWPLSSYTFARAEAARWRGDEAMEEMWTKRRKRLHDRVKDGGSGGPQLLWSR